MPELRKDPVIGRWVIISTERARRPGNIIDPQYRAVVDIKDEPLEDSQNTQEAWICLSKTPILKNDKDFVRTKNSHEVVLQRKKKLRRSRISLPSRTTSQLVVNPPRLMPLGADYEWGRERQGTDGHAPRFRRGPGQSLQSS